MSLKKGSFFSRWSIAARLSVLYTVASCIMLLMLGLYANWALTDTLSNAYQKFLIDEVKVFRNIIQKHPSNYNLLEEEVKWVPEELEATEYHYFARVTDKEKNIYAVTNGMSSLFKDISFPSPANINELPKKFAIWNSPAGKTYLLISAYAQLGDTSTVRLIEIALDISAQEHIITKYHFNLLLILLLGIICATLLSIWVARRGMRALKHITHYAEQISASKLNALDIGDSPKELRNLVQAFNNMLLRIENAFKKLSLFSNELAHELRTPINNLRGEAEIILSKERSVAEYKEVIASSLEEYLRLSRMTENILFLARTENPNVKLDFREINLTDEFEQIAEIFEPLLNEKNIQFNFEGNGTLIAEPTLLRRALNNLVINAIKYTPEEGIISLRTQRTEQEIILIIEDNGIGIEEQHLPHVFNRFYRVKNDELVTNYGLGLGLAIVQSIMELHRGSVSIFSAPGKGTMVYLTFPFKFTSAKN